MCSLRILFSSTVSFVYCALWGFSLFDYFVSTLCTLRILPLFGCFLISRALEVVTLIWLFRWYHMHCNVSSQLNLFTVSAHFKDLVWCVCFVCVIFSLVFGALWGLSLVHCFCSVYALQKIVFISLVSLTSCALWGFHLQFYCFVYKSHTLFNLIASLVVAHFEDALFPIFWLVSRALRGFSRSSNVSLASSLLWVFYIFRLFPYCIEHFEDFLKFHSFFRISRTLSNHKEVIVSLVSCVL